MVLPSAGASKELLDAVEIVEEYGALCEAMYLMMAADRRVTNSEREVLRGALDILSNGRVRTMHMDAMLDAAARRIATEGASARLDRTLFALQGDVARAEVVLVLAAAVALADRVVAPEEHALLQQLARGLGVEETRANALLEELSAPPPVAP